MVSHAKSPSRKPVRVSPRDIVRYVYIASNGYSVKIGVSFNVKRRLSQIQTAQPRPLKIVAVYPVPASLARTVERRAHHHYRRNHMSGEWFQVNPHQAIQTLKRLSGVEPITYEQCVAECAEKPPVEDEVEGDQVEDCRSEADTAVDFYIHLMGCRRGSNDR